MIPLSPAPTEPERHPGCLRLTKDSRERQGPAKPPFGDTAHRQARASAGDREPILTVCHYVTEIWILHALGSRGKDCAKDRVPVARARMPGLRGCAVLGTSPATVPGPILRQEEQVKCH
jgi:hypothetical protein